MPPRSRIGCGTDQDAGGTFSQRYARARDAGYERMADELVEISDADCTADGKPDNALVQQARLRVETRKWILSKMLPKRYGDRITAEMWSLALAVPGRGELPGGPSPADSLGSLPLGKGLPVVVLMGLRYVEVDSIDETEDAYTATVDLRLRWQDLRLQYPPESAPQGFLEFRDEAAAAKIAEIWTPVVSLQNLSGEPSQQMRALRIFPDGRVETTVRTTGTFKTPFDVERFPFDRQRLEVQAVSRRESIERLSLEFEQEDLDFSQPPESNSSPTGCPGWSVSSGTLSTAGTASTWLG